jgi:hypothetical protein
LLGASDPEILTPLVPLLSTPAPGLLLVRLMIHNTRHIASL